ncbi:MAG: type IX secretion system membrane protein PorP/SprF [Flavobacteriales bacterium]|nr:type IX secretion system membrane protein PorP/SprF [Flavobacteriales bacterium]
MKASAKRYRSRRCSFLHGWIRVSVGFLVCFYLSHTANGQQDWLMTLNQFNLYGMNDGFAGASEGLNATVRLREQWIGFEGRPSTQYLSVHSPLWKQTGIGGLVYYDRLGARSRTAAKLSLSGEVATAFAKLRFGLGAKYFYQSYNSAKLTSREAEPEPVSSPVNGGGVALSAGLMLVANNWYLGIQGENLNSPHLGGSVGGYKQLAEIRAIGAYIFSVADEVAIKPNVAARIVPKGTKHVDVGVSALVYNRLWIGGGYRSTSTAFAIVQFRFNESFQIGYAYDYTLSPLATYESGSHEVFLSLLVRKKKKLDTSIRYFE